MGEVCKAAVGLERRQASELITYLLHHYEGNLKDAPAGDTFENLYDPRTLEPVSEYKRVYDEVKAELHQRGLNFVHS